MGTIATLFMVLALAFGPWQSEITQQPVEQQTQGGSTQPDRSLWVLNNTGCAWDADDTRSMGDTNASLAAGETVSGTKCLIADWMEHAVFFDVNAHSRDLIVRLSFEPQGYILQANPVALAKGGYDYWICTDGPDYDRTSLDLQPIPDSGFGGVGVPTTFTASIINPTGRTIRKVNTFVRLAPEPEVAGPGYCTQDFAHLHVGSYPGPWMSWQTS